MGEFKSICPLKRWFHLKPPQETDCTVTMNAETAEIVIMILQHASTVTVASAEY